MSDVSVKCRGAWTIIDDELEQEFYCPWRNECFRYKSRLNNIHATYFDKVPFSLNLKDCVHFIQWS